MNFGGPRVRDVPTRLANRLLRPARSDDSRAVFWVRHVRVGVAISELATVIVLAYFLLADRPHKHAAIGIALSVMVLTPFLLLLPIARLTAGLGGLAIFYSWSLSIVVVIAAISLLDGGVQSPLTWLLILTMVFAALAYPPLGVVLMGVLMMSAYLLVAVLDSSLGPYAWMVTAALGTFTIMATWVSHNQWEAFDEQRRLTNRLAAADHARQQFVASTTHELRTPVTSILGYIELLQDELGAAAPPYLQILQRNGERLRDLAESLVVLSRLESHDVRPVVEGAGAEGADLGLVATWAQQTMAPLAAAQRVTLTLDLPEHPLTVPGSAEQIEQVLLNLMSNAVKYTLPEGSVTCTLSRVGTQARIEVRDTGIGMASEDVERLFTRYFRAESARTSSISGVGLGLSIVQEIVNAHGGDITVSSELGVGTTIVVMLPLAPISRATPRPVPLPQLQAARETS